LRCDRKESASHASERGLHQFHVFSVVVSVCNDRAKYSDRM
jgi:hypothetical protein